MTQLALEAVAPVNPPNWENRTIFTGDNLEVLRRMNTGSVDLCFLDPPFNSNRNYSAPIGSKAAGAAFQDAWTLDDVKEHDHEQLRALNPALHDVILASRLAGGDSTMAYLMMMAARLVEIRRVLKPTASIWLHCDPTASHYLKMVMDCVFGRDNFINEIIWERIKGAGKTSQFGRKSFGSSSDTLLFYSKTEDYLIDIDSVSRPLTAEELDKFSRADDKSPYYRRSPFRPPGLGDRPNLCFEFMGFTPPHPSGWIGTKEFLQSKWDAGDLEIANGKIYNKQRPQAVPPNNVWTDIPQVGGNEDVGYPTQKPTALLERIISASSHQGSVVLDPFAGCATAAVAAEKLQRQWVGIDLSPLAFHLVNQRLDNQLGLPDVSPIWWDTRDKQVGLPERTDYGKLPHYSKHKGTLYGEQGGDCLGCGVHFLPVNFTVDHIVPKSKGGTDRKSNLQLLCGNCNSRKGTGSMSQLMVKLLNERGIR